jgi:hypothetical protein
MIQPQTQHLEQPNATVTTSLNRTFKVQPEMNHTGLVNVTVLALFLSIVEDFQSISVCCGIKRV